MVVSHSRLECRLTCMHSSTCARETSAAKQCSASKAHCLLTMQVSLSPRVGTVYFIAGDNILRKNIYTFDSVSAHPGTAGCSPALRGAQQGLVHTCTASTAEYTGITCALTCLAAAGAVLAAGFEDGSVALLHVNSSRTANAFNRLSYQHASDVQQLVLSLICPSANKGRLSQGLRGHVSGSSADLLASASHGSHKLSPGIASPAQRHTLQEENSQESGGAMDILSLCSDGTLLWSILPDTSVQSVITVCAFQRNKDEPRRVHSQSLSEHVHGASPSEMTTNSSNITKHKCMMVFSLSLCLPMSSLCFAWELSLVTHESNGGCRDLCRGRFTSSQSSRLSMFIPFCQKQHNSMTFPP
jgi:hypothetical protein